MQLPIAFLVLSTLLSDPILAFKGHTLPPNCVAFSPDGKRIVSANYDYDQYLLIMWDVSVATAQPPARLVGLVTSDDPAAVKDLEVHVATSDPTQEIATRSWDSQTVRTDAQGRFVVPALRAGLLRIDVLANKKFSRLADPPRGLLLASGGERRVEIPLRKAVRITGRVIDRRSRRPLPATVFAHSRDGRQVSSVTNSSGEYLILAFPGPLSLTLSPQASAPLADVVLVKDVETIAVPDLLSDGYRLCGRTIGADGKPVGGIHVEASWLGDGPQSHTGLAQSAKSADNGSFILDGIPPDKPVELRASLIGVELMSTVTLKAPQWQPMTLTVRSLEPVTLSGRIVDESGRPIPNAGFRVRMYSRSGPNFITFGPIDEGTTDEQGRFTTKKKLDHQGKYDAQAVIAGRTRGATDQFIPAIAGSNEFPPIIVRAALPPGEKLADTKITERMTLAGRVLDRDGQPVPEAKLIIWSEAKRLPANVSAKGEFALPNIPKQGVLLFVDSPDFRFHGQWAEPGAEPLKISLSRRSEAVAPLRPLADPALPDEVLREAWNAFRPVADALFKEIADNGKIDWSNVYQLGDIEFLELASRFDRPGTLKFVNSHRFKFGFIPNRIRAANIRDRIATAPDEALKLTDQIPDPRERSWRLCDFAVQATGFELAKRERVLKSAHDAISQISKRSQAEALLQLSRSWSELNRPDMAKKFLDEAEERLPTASEADRGGRASFVRGAFAVEKARLEGIDTSQYMSAQLDDFEFNRYCGAIAQGIADRDPATAERLLGTLRGDHDWTSKICYAMAKADPARAERLARLALEPARRAEALGLVALVVAPSHKDDAVRLLDEAYGILQESVEKNHVTRVVQKPVSTALGMLDFVEQIDPGLVREFFWRAVSLRKASTFGNVSMALGHFGPDGSPRYSDPVLAACVARYDSNAARHILRPPGDESTTNVVQGYPYYYFFTSGIFDPRGTIDLVARLPRRTREERNASDEAWRELFASLTHRSHARWDLLREKQMYLWKPGTNGF